MPSPASSAAFGGGRRAQVKLFRKEFHQKAAFCPPSKSGTERFLELRVCELKARWCVPLVSEANELGLRKKLYRRYTKRF
jgi:hypothetical protein